VSRAGPVLLVALVAASVVTAAAVLHARSPKLALEVTRFDREISPSCGCREGVAHIRLFVRESDPHATVEIVGPDLRPVRNLATGRLVAHQPVSFTWNGRTDAGALADPRDRYRLRVLLPDRDRDMVFTRRISLVESGRS
jgi:hypothetical protein